MASPYNSDSDTDGNQGGVAAGQQYPDIQIIPDPFRIPDEREYGLYALGGATARPSYDKSEDHDLAEQYLIDTISSVSPADKEEATREFTEYSEAHGLHTNPQHLGSHHEMVQYFQRVAKVQSSTVQGMVNMTTKVIIPAATAHLHLSAFSIAGLVMAGIGAISLIGGMVIAAIADLQREKKRCKKK